MPDITMCTDEGCGRRQTCYRHRAIPNEFRQSYFMGSVREYDEAGRETCTHYMTVRPGDRLVIDVPGKLHLRVL